MKREIVQIDESKCNGCGNCIPNCHEGALQIIDNKAVLISDLMCDGLGACLGFCPEGALEIVEREAVPYNEIKVMEDMISKGKNVVLAHLKHLKDHNETTFLLQGITCLRDKKTIATFDVESVINEVERPENRIPKAQYITMPKQNHIGCPGSQSLSFSKPDLKSQTNIPSALTQWPVQLHLINPMAAHFKAANLLISADCVAFTLGNFHSDYLQGKKLAIACPKLDSNKEIYLDKLIHLINEAKINTLTVMIMEVPCCGGLLQLVIKAVQSATRKVPVKAITVGIQGEILSEEWV